MPVNWGAQGPMDSQSFVYPWYFPNADQMDRGPSDFDIRNAFSAALTYDIPALKMNAVTNAITGGWSLDNIIQARSAAPVTVNSIVFDGSYAYSFNGYFLYFLPDLKPDTPLYLYGAQYPGGKAFNPAAFIAPPIDPRNYSRPLLGLIKYFCPVDCCP